MRGYMAFHAHIFLRGSFVSFVHAPHRSHVTSSYYLRSTTSTRMTIAPLAYASWQVLHMCVARVSSVHGTVDGWTGSRSHVGLKTRHHVICGAVHYVNTETTLEWDHKGLFVGPFGNLLELGFEVQ